MSNKSMEQRRHLLRLAGRIACQPEPLGVGLKRGCWAGVAIQAAREHGSKTTDYYGLSMREIKAAIKLNNATSPLLRNARMAGETFLKAIT